MGISNRPDPREQKAENIVDSMFQNILDETNAAIKKYTPLVKSLTDLDFAGLYKVVMDERQVRMVRLMIENPLVRQQAIEDLKHSIHDQEN